MSPKMTMPRGGIKIANQQTLKIGLLSCITQMEAMKSQASLKVKEGGRRRASKGDMTVEVGQSDVM